MRRIFEAFVLGIIFIAALQQANAQKLCDRVSQIKVLPFKDEKGIDVNYDALVEAGDSAIPCLISKVTDTKKMRDPRQTPTFGDVRVGDVAYFVLVDISKIDFVGMLPAKVQQRYNTEGVYAYFTFVERYQNRKWLQGRLREWYQKQYGATARNGAA